MSNDTITNPPPTESKSARKKKAKAAEATAVPATQNTSSELGGSDQAKVQDGGENAYIKELHK